MESQDTEPSLRLSEENKLKKNKKNVEQIIQVNLL